MLGKRKGFEGSFSSAVVLICKTRTHALACVYFYAYRSITGQPTSCFTISHSQTIQVTVGVLIIIFLQLHSNTHKWMRLSQLACMIPILFLFADHVIQSNTASSCITTTIWCTILVQWTMCYLMSQSFYITDIFIIRCAVEALKFRNDYSLLCHLVKSNKHVM